jgi:hypothetical protein
MTSNQFSRNPRSSILDPRSSILPALVLAVLIALGGCSRKKTAVVEHGGTQATTPQEHFQAAMKSLEKSATAGFESLLDSVHAREAVEHLNAYLKALAKKPRLRLARADRDRLRRQFHLDPGELTEVDSSKFTALDAHYLESCYQLAQVVRALDMKGLPNLEQARKVFAWVVRQVNLVERTHPLPFTTEEDALLPPQLVLQLGRGTARERAVLFLALLQQLGLDGCVIAIPPPGKKDRQKGTTYWVSGVRIARAEKGRAGRMVPPGIYLFDPRLGIPLPGPQGKGVARLQDVIKDPEAVRGGFEDAAPQSVVPEGIGRAEVALACPLSALSPRMRYLQKQLSTELKVVLAADPARQRQRFQKLTSRPVTVWNQPGDKNTPTRVLRDNFPPRSGGVDRTNRLERIRKTQLVPWLVLQTRYPKELLPTVIARMQRTIARLYGDYCLKPRGLMRRGQSARATEQLQKGQDDYRRAQQLFLERTDGERREKELHQQIAEWSRQVDAAQYQEQEAQKAARENSKDPALQRRLRAARSAVADLFKMNEKLVGLILHMSFGEPVARETKYLLCLSTQEKAERFQTKLERVRRSRQPQPATVRRVQTQAQGAWENAVESWGKFTDAYAVSEEALADRLDAIEELGQQARGNPARGQTALALHDSLVFDLVRTVAARLLRARAQEMQGQRQTALAGLEEQAKEFNRMAKKGYLKRLRQFPNKQLAVGVQVASFAAPDTIAWARASLAYHIERLKKKR